MKNLRHSNQRTQVTYVSQHVQKLIRNQTSKYREPNTLRSYMLKAANSKTFPRQNVFGCYHKMLKMDVSISVYHRWQGEIRSKMMQTIAKLRDTVEELGGKIHVGY